jgi:hypothetical protein
MASGGREALSPYASVATGTNSASGFQNGAANFGRCRHQEATSSSLGRLEGIPAQALIKGCW